MNRISPAGSRADFDIPAQIVYLNCANLCPRLNAVKQAATETIKHTGEPWTIQSTQWFTPPASAEQLFAQLMHAPSANVTLVPSVSYGIAVAARNVPVKAGQNIVVLDREYPSNFYSWSKLARQRQAQMRTVVPGDPEQLTQAIAEAIDADTAVVALPNCRWTDGALIDLVQISKAARRRGAVLVVDASQSAGALPIDVNEIRPDFLVSVGYKWLLGPYGLAYLYVDERWHDDGEPIEESWLHRAGSENFATLVDYTELYKPGAERFGQGAFAHFQLAPMAIAALSTIALWTPERIQARLREWTDELARHARGLGYVSAVRRVGHMVGLALPNGIPPGLLDRLTSEGIHVALRGDVIRVSPHLHSTDGDLRKLIQALERIGS